MKINSLKLLIISLFGERDFLTQNEISKLVDIDKAKLSGYLEAMADYGDLIIKKAGNSKLYFFNDRGK